MLVMLLWGNLSYYYFTYIATLVSVQFWLVTNSYYFLFCAWSSSIWVHWTLSFTPCISSWVETQHSYFIESVIVIAQIDGKLEYKGREANLQAKEAET